MITSLPLIVSFCSGEYGDSVSLETLKDFHRRRVQILAKSGADIIAFETIPNKVEAKVFAKYLVAIQNQMLLKRLFCFVILFLLGT